MRNIDCEEKVNHVEVLRSYECMNACILNHMNQAGIKINGSDIFFAGEGYPISYKRGSLTRIKSDGYNSNFRFLDKYGINYSFGRIKPTKENLLNALQEPYTVTIRMVSDFLTYDTVFMQTAGASHFINVLDYDVTKKRFWIIDGDVPSMKTGCYAGWIGEDDVIQGWKMMQGEILQMEILPNIFAADKMKTIKGDANFHVISAVQRYLHGKRPLLFGNVTGEYAVSYLVEQLGKYSGSHMFRELTQEANFRFRVDGYLGAKFFLLEKMQEKGQGKLAEEYEKVVDSWSKWCMLLLKTGLSNNPKNVEVLKERMQEIVDKERKILMELLA